MTDASNLERAHALESALHRLDAARADIRAILLEDLPTFVERTIREHFLGEAERSTMLTDAEVTALKNASRARGSHFGAEVDAALEDRGVWLAGREIPTSERRGLESLRSVWAQVRGVERVVNELLASFGYSPQALGGVHYSPPARFVGGRYMRSAVEAFWKALADVESIEQIEVESREQESRTKLAARWEIS